MGAVDTQTTPRPKKKAPIKPVVAKSNTRDLAIFDLRNMMRINLNINSHARVYIANKVTLTLKIANKASFGPTLGTFGFNNATFGPVGFGTVGPVACGTIAIAGAESAIGLGFLVALYRLRGSVAIIKKK